MARKKFSLTLKIFIGTAIVVAAVLAVGLLLTSRSANRTARSAIQRGLEATRSQVQSVLADREQKMLSAAGVFVQSAPFRGIVEARNTGDALDQSIEAVEQLRVDWVQITDRVGVRLAKSDDPGARADTLAGSSLIGRALEGNAVSGYGSSGDTLFQAVAVPIVRPSGDAAASGVGVLMATDAVDSTFLSTLRTASGGETEVVVYRLDDQERPRIAASTLPATDELRAIL